MIALLPTTMSYVGICAQHCPHTKPPLKSYDSTTTYYYVICYYICLHGLYTKPLLKRVIALLPTTMSYAITSAYMVCTPSPWKKRMIALLPTTMTYASTSVQHGPYTETPVKTYDSTTTYYYVIC